MELEAVASISGGPAGGSKNINADLLGKVAELTATLTTQEMERKNAQREADALKQENEKLNEQVASLTSYNKTYEDRVKTLEMDLESARKEVQELRDNSLKMAKSPSMLLVVIIIMCSCWC